ncbi:MAG TPA: hypothetical protein VEA59_04695, partial [Patescibacteria group bacterium]|nr:hypothetical protein [Patescibacteria group bacterium]
FLEIQHQFAHSVEHTLLKFSIPKENKISMLAIESIFAQMHAVHTGLNFTQRFIEGKFQLTYHLEIVSFGGKVSLLMRIPKKTEGLVKAAFYAQYPECEIQEVEDYMKNVHFDPYDPNCPIDIFGFEWNLVKPQYGPIKTYKDFESPASEQKIIDPLQSLWESLSQIKPHEFYGIQISIQPLADSEWQDKAAAYVQQLLGNEVHAAGSLLSAIMAPVYKLALFDVKSLLKAPAHDDHGEEKPKEKTFLNLSEVEKEQITLVQRKAGKPGYKTKMRHLYIAPKDKMDGNVKMVIIGSIRGLGSINHNQFKPDVTRTWTAKDYIISPVLEKPYLDSIIKERKKWFFAGYKGRDNHIGLPQVILNVEEIATLYHFPLTPSLEGMTPAPVERIESKKVAPPANLPI